MGKYDVAADILDGKYNTPQKVEPQKKTSTSVGKYDVADILLNAPVQSVYQETGEISTITGEPIKKLSGVPVKGANFSTYLKTGFVDKPEAKIGIFAKDRFPDEPEEQRLKRYGVRDGKIVYVGDDGRIYPETRDDIFGVLKQGVGESFAHTPSAVLGGIGATGGPTGAFGGAALGEAARMQVGKHVFGEEQTTEDYVKNMSVEGLFSLLGYGAGKLTGRLKEAHNIKKGGAMKYMVADDVKRGVLTPEDSARAEFVKTLAKDHGIDLAPHQLYDKESMTDFWKYLRKHPQTSDAVREFEDRLADQADDAMGKFISTLSTKEDPYSVGSRLKKTAGEIIENAELERTKKVSPLYKNAFKYSEKGFDGDGPVDITGVLKDVDSLASSAARGGKSQKILDRLKGMFYREGEKGELIPETRLEVLDNVKKEIDLLLDGPDAPNLHKDVKRRLTLLKNSLVSKMDEASPRYAKARLRYAEMSPEIERMKASVIGRIANKKSDAELMKASESLFSSAQTSPNLVLEAKGIIQKQDPKLWDDAVGSYIRSTYEKLRATETGKILNVPGKMHKALFGSKRQREIMKSALSDTQYQNLEGLMLVFQRASIGAGKESMTMPFNAIQEKFGRVAGSNVYRSMVHTKEFVAEKAFGRWNDILVHGRQQDLLEALTDAQATKIISEMRKLDPNSKRFINSLSTAITIIGGNMWLNSVGDAGQDVEIGTIKTKQQPRLKGR